ncbi:hypothetical protein NKI56_22080 [Mesorhizobium sp. M0622]|uniref:hypothetical protein n=1 Tax=unclassified Mesorhizobium TaxID=325217 RepID=UPI00333CE349
MPDIGTQIAGYNERAPLTLEELRRLEETLAEAGEILGSEAEAPSRACGERAA